MNLHKTALDRIIMNITSGGVIVIPGTDKFKDHNKFIDYMTGLVQKRPTDVSPEVYNGIEQSVDEFAQVYINKNVADNKPRLTGDDYFSISTSEGVFLLENKKDPLYDFTAIHHSDEFGVDQIFSCSAEYQFGLPDDGMFFNIGVDGMVTFDPNGNFDPESITDEYALANHMNQILVQAVTYHFTNQKILQEKN